ncbi:hypothetical protein BaRGS_00013695 [Batillaria attramentaria]|uniref:Uncharacterized protein n=1 Tax=Batillaria attramentaria TaxID=370345 RepID=A0ABD0L7D8_9CAEN
MRSQARQMELEESFLLSKAQGEEALGLTGVELQNFTMEAETKKAQAEEMQLQIEAEERKHQAEAKEKRRREAEASQHEQMRPQMKWPRPN